MVMDGGGEGWEEHIKNLVDNDGLSDYRCNLPDVIQLLIQSSVSTCESKFQNEKGIGIYMDERVVDFPCDTKDDAIKMNF
jgi:hypothetical protein